MILFYTLKVGENMRVNKNTINDYLEGKEINEWDNQWIFHSLVEKEYLIQTVAEDKKDLIEEATNLLENELTNFKPYNKEIWDMIFPNWKTFISGLSIYLIVGCPNPYDAMVRVSPEGEEVMIIDINRMLSYGDSVDELLHTIKNLLTHEYAHLCIHKDYPMLDTTSSFCDKLQYLCFDEGIAHLLSCNDNIKNVNWLDNDRLRKKENAYRMLKNAICSNKRHEELLEKADTGAYWDKYGSISGLFGIIEKFVESNYDYNSILEVYKNGPKKFLLDIFNKDMDFNMNL